MRIGVTGASGMLGTALVSYLSKMHDIFATSRSKGVKNKNIEWDCFDLTDIMLLNKWLEKTKPDVVIHCAAIVNVDLCEENDELAIQLHYETTKVLSNYLDFNKGRLIYISTDSVFDGEKQNPYKESDFVRPLNVYSKTKLMGEKAVQLMDNGLVLRTNIVGWTQEGRTSFAEWVLRGLIDNTPLNLFCDVYFSPLSVYDFSIIIERIINQPIYGLYHCASCDSISKYDFGKKMAKIFHILDSNINKVNVDCMDFKAKRPRNMALNIERISLDLGYDFPDAIDAIKLMKKQYYNKKDLFN